MIAKAINYLFLIAGAEYALAFLRGVLTAKYFGVSEQTDAYFFVYGLILFIAIVIAGFIKTSFIPVFLDCKKSSGEKEAWNFAVSFAFIVLSLLVLAILVCEIFAQQIIKFMVPGFNDITQSLSMRFLRELSPIIVLVSAIAFSSALLNAYFKFIRAALPNLAGVGLFILLMCTLHKISGITSLIIASLSQFVLILGLQLFLVLLVKNGISRQKLSIDLKNPYLWHAIKILLPLLLILLTNQVLKFIENFLLSKTHEGSISILSYARIFSDAPGRIMMTAVSTVFLPIASSCYIINDISGISIAVKKQLRFILFFFTPIVILFLLKPDRVISVFLGYGKFDIGDINATSKALFFYSLGIFGYASGVVANQAYVAMRNIGDLVKITIFGVVITAIFYFALIKFVGFLGIAIGFAAGSIITNALLLYFLQTKYKMQIITFSPFIIKIFLAGLVTAGVAMLTRNSIINAFLSPKLNIVADLALSFIVSALAYSIMCYLLGIEEITTFFNRIAKGFNK